jgi:hypothetical protein
MFVCIGVISVPVNVDAAMLLRPVIPPPFENASDVPGESTILPDEVEEMIMSPVSLMHNSHDLLSLVILIADADDVIMSREHDGSLVPMPTIPLVVILVRCPIEVIIG